MDKGLMFFVVIGVGFLYFITNFIGGIQEEDEAYRNNDYNQEHKYDAYMAVDSIGQDILDVTDANLETQIGAWNQSLLKSEFLELFPDFDEMKHFVDDRVRGKILHNKLTNKINNIENKFFSGGITATDAKRELSTLK